MPELKKAEWRPLTIEDFAALFRKYVASPAVLTPLPSWISERFPGQTPQILRDQVVRELGCAGVTATCLAPIHPRRLLSPAAVWHYYAYQRQAAVSMHMLALFAKPRSGP